MRPPMSRRRASWNTIGGRSIDVKISGPRLGRGKGDRIVDMTPAKMKVMAEGSPKRLVTRLITVTSRSMLYTAPNCPRRDKFYLNTFKKVL